MKWRFTTLHIVLLSVSVAHADLSIIEGRLSADVLLWGNCRWQYVEQGGFGESRFDFYRRGALAGATGTINSVATVRVLFDVAGPSAYDMYADLRWPNGMAVRVGQFVPPVGTEAQQAFREWKFIEYSLVSTWRKPSGLLDIGVMTSYDVPVFGVAAAVVNGNGRNRLEDDNQWKDVCGRVAFRPGASPSPEFACRAYYGKMGEERFPFWNVGGEFLFAPRSLRVAIEAQHAEAKSPKNALNVEAAWAATAIIEPVARLELELLPDRNSNLVITGGINFPVKGDQLKVMIDYVHWRKLSPLAASRGTEQRLFVQLQAAL